MTDELNFEFELDGGGADDAAAGPPMRLHTTQALRFDSLNRLIEHCEGLSLGLGFTAKAVLARAALAELLEDAACRQEGAPMDSVDQALALVRSAAAYLAGRGLVLEVRQQPLQPLRQGNNLTVIEAVPGRTEVRA